jgi:hypothetical protein
VDLTFANHQPGGSKANVESETPLAIYIASGPFDFNIRKTACLEDANVEIGPLAAHQSKTPNDQTTRDIATVSLI